MPADRDLVPGPRRGPVLLATAALSAILTIATLGALGHLRAPPPEPEVVAVASVPSVPAPPVAEPPPLRMSVLTVRLGRNQTLSQALSRLELAPGQAQAILEALRNKFPFHRARPGDQIRVERVEGEKALHRFTYRQSVADEWTVVPGEGGALVGEKRAVALTTEVARVDVEIRGSVWESLSRAGEDPGLASAASDVLAWDVDFYQDVRSGDRMKVLVEKVYADGRLLRYGEVLAASYEGAVSGRKRLFRYTDPDGQTSYFDDEGNSARRGFLKMPLPYAHLTSKFGSRVHPVLGYVQAHQGVDYGAPTGTPVWSVGDGTVAQAGWNGNCGKSVTVRHRNGFDTVYCHLSTVAVHTGSHVAQKQVIGAVGATGRATGPHLHYAV
ncbi:MAG TPA: M23 family metallopeptidase, partial [Anaeromyxobacteraceae bacterium]|nr:M23 family metallopeptidase [Anaeromyxobacteraceae bacterium]